MDILTAFLNRSLFITKTSSNKIYRKKDKDKKLIKNCNKTYRKKDKDKKLIKNWRPISLLDVETKLISKVLAKKLKKVLPSLISKNQTAYVKGRCIKEGGRLISDILEISDDLKITGFLMKLDIEKVFDSVNNLFLIKALEVWF